ncbi:Probable bifunctional methylthioribulose-1-phosphate dehydratase/enolase-phosphatase E1 2 [Linum perenne]
MSPSGVHKERMQPDDMYVMSGDGSIMHAPSPKPYPHKPPNCCDCAPLFMKLLAQLSSHCNWELQRIRCDAGAVIHSHEMEESCLLAMLSPMSTEFRVEAYPKTTAELVWNHGINVRGDTWISAKTQEHEGDKTSSYIQMSESLGVDSPSEILFLTDVLQEAVAAEGAAAGKKKGSKLSMLEKTSIPNARRRLCQRIMGSRSINSFWKI